ncbi:unnamed protein product [Cercopithifilaria johnstoni]|uniref:Uncharacterized protein n=1 Tax=Cercopithifilaria johnstoni TaxID=2874296 RepID=A0A8J2M1C2_9BILA|nr:unnamed protein product [Cercopithifilaria johnstoni]
MKSQKLTKTPKSFCNWSSGVTHGRHTIYREDLECYIASVMVSGSGLDFCVLGFRGYSVASSISVTFPKLANFSGDICARTHKLMNFRLMMSISGTSNILILIGLVCELCGECSKI